MKTIFSLTLCLLLTGCSLQVTVIDGACNPVENAKIYYTLEGINSFVPYGPVFTSQAGTAKLPSGTDTITIKKEEYKLAHIEAILSNPIKIFLYTESEEHESGLFDLKECKGNI